jgi:hypothetical protein
VSTSPLIGAYLHAQKTLWATACAVPALMVQLEKAGMDRTECGEVREQLAELADRYLE